MTTWIYSTILMLMATPALSTNPLQADTCEETGLDIVFLLDTSSSIWLPDFHRQLKFVRDVGKLFDLGHGARQTRIGVATFANTYYLQFHLWQNNRMSFLTSALNRIRHRAGKYTNTGSALKFAWKYMFTHRYGSRKDALHVIVVITDGRSQNRKSTLQAAQNAKDDGIFIFSIGVGSATDEKELEQIASEPTREFHYQVEDYRSLDAIKFVIAKRACRAEEIVEATTILTTPPTTPMTTTTPFNVILNNRPGPQADIDPKLNVTNCGGKPAEIYFALDASNSIWPEDFRKQLAFVRDLISLFDIQREKTRIGLITFSDHVKPIITLDNNQNKANLFEKMKNITYMSGRTDTAKALQFIREHGFSRDVARREVAHIVLLFTDGLSRYPRNTAREAELSRRDGIYLFSIGIGMSVEKTELQDIASDPDEDFVFHVIDFNVLNTIKDILAIKTCAIEPNAYSDQATLDCNINRRTDLMFVYDSAQIGMHNTRKITQFVYDVSQELGQLDGGRKLKMGRLTENCLTGADVFLTNQRSSLDFDQIYFPDFRRMIRKLASIGFSPQYGATHGAKKVAVLFLDDGMENLKQASDEIRRLRETHTYVVTIGDVNGNTAAAFSSQPASDHIVHIPSYKYLSTAKSTLLQKLCKVLEI